MTDLRNLNFWKLYKTIEQIRIRHERATIGPWGPSVKFVYGEHQMVGSQSFGVRCSGKRCVAAASTEPDAEFIEHSWEDIEFLLATVKALLNSGLFRKLQKASAEK